VYDELEPGREMVRRRQEHHASSASPTRPRPRGFWLMEISWRFRRASGSGCRSCTPSKELEGGSGAPTADCGRSPRRLDFLSSSWRSVSCTR
jgi:hypothetical protein